MTSNPQTELLNNIPAELRAQPLWLQYYLKYDPKHPDKKPGKCPCMKYGTPEDRANNLRSLDHLLTRPKQAGFQRWVSKNEGFVFVDLDHVRNVDTTEVEPWAEQLIEQLDSYTEISASGTGFHIVCKGTLPEDVEPSPDSKVEIYSGASRPNKLIAMTGDIIDVFHKLIEPRQEQLDQLFKSVKSKTEPTTEPIVVDWRKVYHTVEELPDGEISWLIEDILPEGVGFVGALSGAGKTWFCLSLSKALTTGKKFVGNYNVTEPVNVIYICPEMGAKPFKKRCKMFGINDRFRCQTIADGVPQSLLENVALAAAVKELKPVIFLDTAIRFGKVDDENSSAECNRGLAKDAFGLIHLGARAVVCLHHRAKAGAEATEMTLENCLRGTGDLGAICDVTWGLQFDKGNGDPQYMKESRQNVRLHVRCVKARDFQTPEDFKIQLAPFIENIGDFGILEGDAGSLANDQRQSEANKVGAVIAENQKASLREIAMKTSINKNRIKKIADDAGWYQTDEGWQKSSEMESIQ